MPAKNLFIGYFFFNHTKYIERCMAYSKRQAYYVFCRRIADKQGVDPIMVFNHFKNGNYQIETEIEFEEVENE